MVPADPLGELVPGHARAEMRGEDPGVGHHGQGAVEGGEGHALVERGVQLGGRARSVGTGEGGDDGTAAAGVAHLMGSEALSDQLLGGAGRHVDGSRAP